jgi:predicted molibdopterin-dependent oxidoreductase YjgC
MRNINVTIDGNKVSGQAGETILEVAKQGGIEIPTLCHQDGIKPSGNCRICVVEVEGSRTLVGSCHQGFEGASGDHRTLANGAHGSLRDRHGGKGVRAA